MNNNAKKYTKSEIRVMRLFVIVLWAIGAFSLVKGIITIDMWPKDMSAAYSKHSSSLDTKGSYGGKDKGPGYAGNIPLMYFVGALAFLALGTAGAVAITKVINNGGIDVEIDPVDKKCT